MNIKRKIIVLFATGIMAFSVSPFALAATPVPANNTQQAQTQQADQQGNAAAATIAPAAGIAQTQNTESQAVNKKYLSKGGAAFWFVFTVLLNAVLSFWIGNRFYRLAKKDNHVSGEIRALRKDIEERFSKSIGGFAEQEVDINNMNDSMAMDDDGIRLVERKPVIKEISPEEEERFKRWEAAQSKQKGERVRPKSIVKEELDEDFDDVKKIRRKNYQPKRNQDVDSFDDQDDLEDLGETREIKIKGEGVRTKAKELLSDIFPFKED